MKDDNPSPPHSLDVTEPAAGSVPTFRCIVYVKQVPEGVAARVANLPNIACTGESERSALTKIVREFKTQTKHYLAEGHDIPWLEPPAPIAENEQERLIAVHH